MMGCSPLTSCLLAWNLHSPETITSSLTRDGRMQLSTSGGAVICDLLGPKSRSTKHRPPGHFVGTHGPSCRDIRLSSMVRSCADIDLLVLLGHAMFTHSLNMDNQHVQRWQPVDNMHSRHTKQEHGFGVHCTFTTPNN